MKLIADAMLGGLARWLRVLGVDVTYDPRWDDAELVERSVAEGRVILTRDRALVLRRRARNHLFVRSGEIAEQLAQVFGELRFAPEPESFLGRCLRCNDALAPLSAEAARSRVPEYVAETQPEFRECPRCRRVYWPATHVRRMRERLRALGLG
jgi:hypothetical protein